MPRTARRTREPASERLFIAAFAAGVLVLTFVLGAIVASAQVFPGTVIAQAYQGGHALYDRLTRYDDVFGTDLWYPARWSERGVTLHDRPRAQQGLTLFTSGDAPVARLIDMDGRILHEWRKPYSQVWSSRVSPVRDPQPDSHVYFRKAHVFRNGDLLAIYEGVGDTPYGYGMVKLDRDSQVIWFYPGRTHHSFDVAEDGRIYVLTHGIAPEPLPGFSHLGAARIEDFLVVLSPDGAVLDKFDLTKAIADSPYQHMLHTVSWYSVADPLHSNDVDVINARAAEAFAFADEGQVLLSFRELGAIAVFDTQSRAITWATRGAWLGQHDPDITKGGRVLMFDNYGRYENAGGRSRVIEFDPSTMEIVWQYGGTAARPLESEIRASQQRLPNGNTLITESSGGRILEVTRDGAPVWEFIIPVRGGTGNGYIPIICFAERLDPSDLEPGLLTPHPAHFGSWKEVSR